MDINPTLTRNEAYEILKLFINLKGIEIRKGFYVLKLPNIELTSDKRQYSIFVERGFGSGIRSNTCYCPEYSDWGFNDLKDLFNEIISYYN